MVHNNHTAPALYSLLTNKNSQDYKAVTNWVQSEQLDQHDKPCQATAKMTNVMTLPSGEPIYKIMPWNTAGFSVISQDGRTIQTYTDAQGWSEAIKSLEFINYVFSWQGQTVLAGLKSCTLAFYANNKCKDTLDLRTITGLEELQTLNKIYALPDNTFFFTGNLNWRVHNGIIDPVTNRLTWFEESSSSAGGRIVRHNKVDILIDYKMLKIFNNTSQTRRLKQVVPLLRRGMVLPLAHGYYVISEDWRLIKLSPDFATEFVVKLADILPSDTLSYSPTIAYSGNNSGAALYVSGYYLKSIFQIRINHDL